MFIDGIPSHKHFCLDFEDLASKDKIINRTPRSFSTLRSFTAFVNEHLDLYIPLILHFNKGLNTSALRFLLRYKVSTDNTTRQL